MWVNHLNRALTNRFYLPQEIGLEDYLFAPLKGVMQDLRQLRSRGPRRQMDVTSRLVLARYGLN